ncbi:MAG: DUF1697 domain-containing protein [Acidimicrobiales bacterium]
MPTWIGLLRAVNLGSHNKVPMPALRKAMEAAGFAEVRTYVQSGNVVATSARLTRDEVAERISVLVKEEFGVGSPVVVRTPSELDLVVKANPFPGAASERPRMLHVVFLAGVPDVAGVKALAGHELAKDACLVDGDHLYVDYGEGVHSSRLTPQFLSRVLSVEGTARNWRTVLALQEMARQPTPPPALHGRAEPGERAR